ncbi:hypothetical protein Hanom_Chr16g01424311 [Helianthus anomalus]
MPKTELNQHVVSERMLISRFCFVSVNLDYNRKTVLKILYKIPFCHPKSSSRIITDDYGSLRMITDLGFHHLECISDHYGSSLIITDHYGSITDPLRIHH